MRISVSPDVRDGYIATASQQLIGSRIPPRERRTGAGSGSRVQAKKRDAGSSSRPIKGTVKKKMRAFRPASRRHGGSAGGIATAATCVWQPLHHPVGHRAVIVVDTLAVSLVLPVGLTLAVVHRGGFELFLGKRHDVAAALRVIVENAPRDRMVLFAEPEKAAERHDGVGDLAGLLVEHHVVDFAEMVATRIINVGACDAGAGNQRI